MNSYSHFPCTWILNWTIGEFFSVIRVFHYTMKEYVWIIYFWLWSTGCSSKSDAGFETRMRETYPELYSNHFEGDMLFFDKTPLKNALRDESARWPNRKIPYVIGSNFTKRDGASILKAMRALQNETCVEFTPRKSERNFILVDNKKKGCFATVGYNAEANRPHPVNLARGCLGQGTIQHELLHAMGLHHEQSRPDRDKHVIVFFENISKGSESNFRKLSASRVTTFDIPYDFNSVMHYPRRAFSRNGKDTIVSKNNPNMKLGQRVRAAPSDLDKIRKIYECNDQLKSFESSDRFLEEIHKFYDDDSKSDIF